VTGAGDARVAELTDARGLPYELAADGDAVVIVVNGVALRLGEAERDQFEAEWVKASAEAATPGDVIGAGSLSVVPLRLAIRRPGIGGASPHPVTSGGTDAGHGWTVRPVPPPPTCEWTPCFPHGGPDLGYLATGYGAVLEHP
jgi:hypothetical protein